MSRTSEICRAIIKGLTFVPSDSLEERRKHNAGKKYLRKYWLEITHFDEKLKPLDSGNSQESRNENWTILLKTTGGKAMHYLWEIMIWMTDLSSEMEARRKEHNILKRLKGKN